MIPKDLILEGEHVRLEPLALGHAGDLFACGNDEAIWNPAALRNHASSLQTMQEYITEALCVVDARSLYAPFGIIHRDTGRAIGSTRYADISEADRRIEIGWTWIARSYWRTAVNTECKLLLLTYAFEQAKVNRTQLKADSENARSRAAMVRLGATYEGTLRDYRIREGRVRSVSYYSILAAEWPAIKRGLQEKLATHITSAI